VKISKSKNEEIKMSKTLTPRCGVRVAILKNFIDAVGGHDGVNYLKC
jgi:hypothetical protein